MTNDVLRDHPNSAKAHYVEAEILAKQGRPADARSELDRAEQLAPVLPFVSQTSVQELRGLIGSEGTRQLPGVTSIPPAIAPRAHESSFPWGLVLIVLIGGAIVFAIIRERRNAASASSAGIGGPSSGSPPTAPGGGGVAPYGAPPMVPAAGGIGSSIVGGLVTGAAVGAGVVAGEALAHELVGGHASSGDVQKGDVPATSADKDLGGQDFGIDDTASWDDDSDSAGGGGGDDWS